MADTQEILSYKLDLTDVEAKANRLLQLQQQIMDGRAKGKDTSPLEQELQKEIDALAKLEPARKKAGDSILDWSNKGEKSLKSLLSVVNPQLAQMADLFLDVAEGAGAMSGPLLAIAGLGAAVAILTASLRDMAAEEERISKALQDQYAAREKLRSKGAEERGQFIGELGALGVYGRSKEAQATFEDLRGRFPGREELAASVAKAEALAAAKGAEFDREAYTAGLTTQGLKAPEFAAGKDEENLRLLAEIQEKGRSEDARKALAVLEHELRGGMPAAQIGGSPAAQIRGQVDPLDAARADIAAQHPDVKPEDLDRVMMVARLLRDGKLAPPDLAETHYGEEAGAANVLGARSWWSEIATRRGPEETIRDRPVPQSNMTVGQILDLVRELVGQAAPSGSGPREVPTTQPVTINLTVNNSNAGTVYNDRRQPMSHLFQRGGDVISGR